MKVLGLLNIQLVFSYVNGQIRSKNFCSRNGKEEVFLVIEENFGVEVSYCRMDFSENLFKG